MRGKYTCGKHEITTAGKHLVLEKQVVADRWALRAWYVSPLQHVNFVSCSCAVWSATAPDLHNNSVPQLYSEFKIGYKYMAIRALPDFVPTSVLLICYLQGAL